MKNYIDTHLKDLLSIGVESTLLVFRNCFSFLSYSFENPTTEELDNWITQLENSKLTSMWARQKTMKYSSFMLYFAIWHFRDKTLYEKEYSREYFKDQKVLDKTYDKANKITNKINRYIDELTVFEGVEFLGRLIGVWMLSCPKDKILEINSPPNPKPDKAWLESVFSNTLENDISNDELELLYKLDYHLYLTFEDVEARNTF